MRSDLLSKRLFFVGCLGLPWLWIVHVLYWRGNTRESNEGLLNPDDHFQEEPADQEATAEEIEREAAKWVLRCKRSALVFCTFWVVWIVIAQVLRGKPLGSSWYMLSPDDAAVTGW